MQYRTYNVQVYSTTLLVHAEFSGLRHIMFHHPWISSAAGNIYKSGGEVVGARGRGVSKGGQNFVYRVS